MQILRQKPTSLDKRCRQQSQKFALLSQGAAALVSSHEQSVTLRGEKASCSPRKKARTAMIVNLTVIRTDHDENRALKPKISAGFKPATEIFGKTRTATPSKNADAMA